MNSRLFIPVTLSIYALLIGTLTLFHEPWRDEYQIWAGVTSCPNFLDFLTLRSTESHPIIWDFLQFIISRFTHNFIYIQLANILFSLISAFLILRYSPFKNYQKLLLLFSYYFIFEFSIMARSYALGTMLLFSIIVLFSKKRDSYAIFLAVLAANTNILAAIIITCITIYLWYTKRLTFFKSFLIALGVLVCFSDVFYQTFFNWGFQNESTFLKSTLNINFLLAKTALLFKGFIPIPNITDPYFWNTHITDILPYPFSLASAMFLSLVLITMVYYLFKKKFFILIPFLIGCLFMFILYSFFWGGSQRHWGHFFILFLVLYWLFLQQYQESKFAKWSFSIILSLQLLAGTFAYFSDLNRPFSNSGKVAKYLTNHFNLQNTLLTGAFDYAITPVVAKISDTTTFYNLQSGKMESYIDWNRFDEPSWFNFKPRKINKKEILFINSKQINYGVIHTKHLALLTHQKPPILFHHLKSFDNAIVADENYDIYHVEYTPNYKGFTLESNVNSMARLSNASFYIDKFVETRNDYTISGWVMSERVNDLKEKYLLLEGESKKHISLTETKLRFDLKEQTKNNKNLYAGFFAKVDKNRITQGDYKLSIILFDHKKAFKVPLNKVLLK